MNMKRLYIAYGSNLNRQQMAERCPTAKILGTSALSDQRLLFRGPGGGAVATVEGFKGGSVPVLLWEITGRTGVFGRYEGWRSFTEKKE